MTTISKNPEAYIYYIKELEEAKKKAEEADKLKTAFLANMSHEIRTPMNAILGFSSLLENETLTHEVRKEYLGIIQSSGNQLLKLIEDIIDIAKIEAGEINIETAPVQINHLLKELWLMFSKSIEEKNKAIELYVFCESDYHHFAVLSDYYRLKQVLSNLIGNAVKFTHAGNIDFGYSVFNETIQFYVKDTGIGIPKSMHDKIFDRFRQVGVIQNEGAGLGLSITKGIVKLLGGHIWLTSEEGKGTTFYFTIPYKKVIVSNDEEIMNDQLQLEKI